MSSEQHAKLIEIFQGMLSMEEDRRQWQFTLPELYDFCCQSNREIIELGYPGFRKLLYQYPTNQKIAGSGGQFVVVENKGHVDRNVYALIRGG